MPSDPRTQTFLFAHRGHHVLYAPLLQTALLINRAMAELIGGSIDSRKPAARDTQRLLRELGLYGRAAPQPPRSAVDERPTAVSLLVTERCNLRCLYCYANGGQGRRTMPFELARAAVDQVIRNALERGAADVSVHFHGGGEITQAWPLVRRIHRYASNQAGRRGLRVEFSAGLNGVMSTRRARELADLLDEATISIDGLPAIHNAQRPTAGGRATARIVLRNLARFDELGFRYGLRMTALPSGIDRLPESVEFLCRHSQARLVQVEPVYPHGRYRHGPALSPERFVRRFRAARLVARQQQRELRYSGARYPHITDVFCQAVTGAFAVNPAGFVTSCYEASDERDAKSAAFIYGRYDRQERHFAIDHAARARLRRFSVSQRPDCIDCLCRYHCAGDCAYKRLSRVESPRCIINRELTKDLILEDLQVTPNDCP